MQVECGGFPLAENVGPRHTHPRIVIGGVRLPRVRGFVPVAQPRIRVVGATTNILRPIGTRARVIGTVGSVNKGYCFFAGVFRFRGFFCGPFGSDCCRACVGSAVSPFPTDSQYDTAGFSPIP